MHVKPGNFRKHLSILSLMVTASHTSGVNLCQKPSESQPSPSPPLAREDREKQRFDMSAPSSSVDRASPDASPQDTARNHDNDHTTAARLDQLDFNDVAKTFVLSAPTPERLAQVRSYFLFGHHRPLQSPNSQRTPRRHSPSPPRRPSKQALRRAER